MTYPPNLLPNMVGKGTANFPKDLQVEKAVALWKAAPAFVPVNQTKCTINTKKIPKSTSDPLNFLSPLQSMLANRTRRF